MATYIQIWVSKGSDRFRFPVVPESFKINSDINYEDVDVLQLGEITRFGNAKQREINFESFFPRDYHPSYCEYNPVPRPYDAVNKLLNWMNAKEEVQLLIVGSNINMPVTIRSFEYSEEGGSPGDVSFEITFKEYKKISPRIYDPTAVVTRPGSPTTGGTYTVVKGDSLRTIAQRLLGSASKWNVIYEANKAKIGSNANKIFPGQVLTIPGTTSTTTPTTAGGTFTIRSGDTLYEIANAYTNTTVSALLSLNPTIKATSLKVGSTIKLPSNAVKLRDPKRIGVSSSASTAKSVTTTPASPSVVALTQWQTTERSATTNPTDFFPTN